MSSSLETTSEKPQTEVVIVGAGPIGLELAVEFSRRQISFIILDAGAIGHTISWWAPQTRWFSSNDRISIAGVPLLTHDQNKATREQYLTYLRSVVEQFSIDVRCYERVVQILDRDSGFTVVSESEQGRKEINCNQVILAVGGLDRARKLGIEGEVLPHVDGYLREPHNYYGRRVLIVGGRNSAVEAALRLHHVGAHVSLSYRGSQLPQDNIKYWLYPEITGLIRSGLIQAHFDTRPIRITPTYVELEHVNPQTSGERIQVPTDDVLTLIGYEQEKSLFRQAGIELLDESQRPLVNEATMESNVPGIYVAGTAVAGTQSSEYRLFLENCHEHVTKILAHITGEEIDRAEPDWKQAVIDAPES
ncbi:MAG: NAD(P)-binding domain-containing protein [Planctomycetaceae bacterium]|nr:NAD(P)-binding domain-containing protein [Planctomycetaceae bacterium]